MSSESPLHPMSGSAHGSPGNENQTSKGQVERSRHPLLSDTRRQLEAVCNNATLALFIMDERQHCVFMNPAAERLTGYTLAEVLGQPLHEFVHHTRPDGSPYPLSECPIDQAFPQNNQEQGDEVFVHKDGRFYHVSFTASPIRDEAEQPIGTVIEVRDITGEKQVEQTLRQSAQFTRRVLDNLFAFVGVLALDGTLVEANRAPLEAAGIPASEVLGKKFWDCYWWSYSPQVQEQLRGAWARAVRGETVRYDVPVRMGGDSRRWIDFQLAPLRDEQGRITHLIPSAMDITERREVEAALREKEALLDAVLEAAPVGIIVADAAGKLLRMNPANDRIWGSAPFSEQIEEYREWNGWWADGSERHGMRLEARDWAMARALRGEVVPSDLIEIEPFDAPGTRRTILNSGAPVRSADGQIIGGVVAQMDITDRVRAEAGLREGERRFRALADNIPQLAWMTDETGWIFWYNRRWFDYTGATLEEMQGWGWQKVHHPEHLERVTEKFRRHVATGAGWEDTFPLRRHDGEYRWFLSRAAPIRDESGRIAHWFGTNTDITEQRETEEVLRETDRRKDEFLAMLAHELRNPLVPITNAVAILRARGPQDPLLERQREIIRRQAEHMARLVSDLLEVSRISRGKFTLQQKSVDLVEMLRSCTGDYLPSAQEAGIQLEMEISGEAQWVHGDAVRLCQAVNNLLSNALKFTPSGGRIHVALRRAPGGHGGEPGEEAVITVRDSGPGIPAELLPRIWEPFTQGEQELDRSRGGLGLGLALVKRIIEGHSGTVEARNAEAGGAEFVLTLPLTRAEQRPQASSLTTPSDPGGAGGRILLIEDNVDAADTLEELLELKGYEVRVARDGLSGAELASSWVPDLVLCDIGLPGLNGYQVAERLREDPRTRSVRLVAISGYAQPDQMARGRAAGFDEYLPKPIDPDQLLHLVAAYT